MNKFSNYVIWINFQYFFGIKHCMKLAKGFHRTFQQWLSFKGKQLLPEERLARFNVWAQQFSNFLYSAIQYMRVDIAKFFNRNVRGKIRDVQKIMSRGIHLIPSYFGTQKIFVVGPELGQDVVVPFPSHSTCIIIIIIIIIIIDIDLV